MFFDIDGFSDVLFDSEIEIGWLESLKGGDWLEEMDFNWICDFFEDCWSILILFFLGRFIVKGFVFLGYVLELCVLWVVCDGKKIVFFVNFFFDKVFFWIGFLNDFFGSFLCFKVIEL